MLWLCLRTLAPIDSLRHFVYTLYTIAVVLSIASNVNFFKLLESTVLTLIDRLLSDSIADPNSKSQLKKHREKWNLMKFEKAGGSGSGKKGLGRKPKPQGGLSHRLFKPLGVSVSSPRAQVTQKLRMMIRTPYPVSYNPDSDAVGLNYNPRHSRGSRRVALSETRSRLCI